MELNGKKFECLRYGFDEDIKLSTNYTSNTGVIISEEDQVRDLGVTVHRSGGFDIVTYTNINSNLCFI